MSTNNNIGFYFYSKTQENIMRNIEGLKYRDKKVIVNGKKIPFTEKNRTNKSIYPDAKLMITAYDNDAIII